MYNINQLQRMFEDIAFKNGKYSGKRLPENLRVAIECSEIGNMQTYKEKIFALVTGEHIKPKCYCGGQTTLISTTKGFTQYCSVKCAAGSDQTKNIRQQTNFNKFGVDNPGQSSLIKQKIKTTSMERYGVINPGSSNLAKTKRMHTLIEKYGVDNPGKTQVSRIAAAETMTSPKIREKITATMLERYGYTSVLYNKEIKKEGMLRKYGVDHNSKLPEIIDRKKATQAQTYTKKFLPSRLYGLSLLDIYPHGWDINSYTGGAISFLHKKCGKTFVAQFEDGKLPLCTHCKKPQSMVEQLLAASLKKFCIIKQNDRSIIAPKEIDILIENIGVEVNGIYWHSEKSLSIPILEKTKMAHSKGIQLLHFWEYEINNKLDIVTSIILSKCKKTPKRELARNCHFAYLEKDQAREFFDENHLNGFCAGEKYYALFNKTDEIVFAVIIGKSRFTKNKIPEIIRLSSCKFTYVVGGFEKLMKKIKKDYANQILITFADKRYSNGLAYERLGFIKIAETKPNYFWIKGKCILSRYSTQKHKLYKLLGDGFDGNKTEDENMYFNGWIKIKDCGNLKYSIQL